MDDFLMKPVKSRDLKLVVEKTIALCNRQRLNEARTKFSL